MLSKINLFLMIFHILTDVIKFKNQKLKKGIHYKKIPEKTQIASLLKEFVYDAISINTNYTSSIEVKNF